MGLVKISHQMTMKLLSLGLLVTALIAITKQQDLDAELDDIFTQIEAKLKDRQEVKDLIKEVKDEVTKKPDITARALGMAKAMNLAIPKFQTGRATDVSLMKKILILGLVTLINTTTLAWVTIPFLVG